MMPRQTPAPVPVPLPSGGGDLQLGPCNLRHRLIIQAWPSRCV